MSALPQIVPGTPRVAVLGAGVIGRVLAARLALGGIDVALIARGETLVHLREEGVRLRSEGSEQAVPVTIEPVEHPGPRDLVFLCLRANALEQVLPTIEAMGEPIVVPLMHVGDRLSVLHEQFGIDRVVSTFPGLGGFLDEDGVVEWLALGAKQPTTVDGRAARADLVRTVLRHTGLPLASTPDMPSWMSTHVVFVAGMGAGLVAADGDPAALGRNTALLRACVQAVRSGLSALRARGVAVQPRPIELLFLRMPTWFAVAYWRRALPGPVGRIAMAPHAWASRFDEMPVLWRQATQLASGPEGALFRAFLARTQCEQSSPRGRVPPQ